MKINEKIRTSQGISPFGVGAIVDFKNVSLMAGSIKYWKEENTSEIYDERLSKILGVNKFRVPMSTTNKKPVEGFPFVVFPEWYFCPKCRIFKRIEEWEKDFTRRNKNAWEMEVPKCSDCKINLVPARILSVCKHGHIQDFPWVAWTHYRSKKKICDNPKLKICTFGSTSGLEGIKIECTNCGAKTTLRGAFNKEVFKDIIDKLYADNKINYAREFQCKGYMPWENESEECKSPNELMTVQRGANNVYYSKIISSIVIPPYSNLITKKIENSKIFKYIVDSIKFEDYSIKDYIESGKFHNLIDKLANDISCSVSEVQKIVLRKVLPEKEYESEFDEKKYRIQEYKAITGVIKPEGIDNDFVIEDKDINNYNLNFLSKVVLVKKMREVRSLVGFTRIYPPDRSYLSFDDEAKEATFVNIKKSNIDWYPAYQVRGEGIFIEIDKKMLDTWAEKKIVNDRISVLNKRAYEFNNKRNITDREITPQFVLLHTLAHLLIRQLSFESGYSSAALREKIYYSNDEYNMNGILIYTASGDSEGSLGGLIRQGESDKLAKLIIKSLSGAQWCSNDPVCIESSAQGSYSLNISACYACSLISETSCEEFNVFLDRGVVIGTLDNPEIGFFTKYLID
ncbi:DUF1998 domain-containing protein [Clostridiaceae bacterium HSG29]|nr:DUF1998 domain-containing protein [Clostridiaceae bacterium HSG29]